MTNRDPSIPDEPKASASAEDALTRSVGEMSDDELRELASAVLAELLARTSNPTNQGSSYLSLVADLKRRLADAHALAQTGFGHRNKKLTNQLASSLSSPAPAALSEEKKAMLLTGLEAELLSELAPSDPGASVELPIGWDLPGESIDGGASTAPSQDPEPSASIEADIWEALQIEVARAAGTPPARPDDASDR